MSRKTDDDIYGNKKPQLPGNFNKVVKIRAVPGPVITATESTDWLTMVADTPDSMTLVISVPFPRKKPEMTTVVPPDTEPNAGLTPVPEQAGKAESVGVSVTWL